MTARGRGKRAATWLAAARVGRLLRGLSLLLALLFARPVFACEGVAAVCPEGGPAAVALISSSRPAAILSDAGDDDGVLRAVRDLRADLRRVAGQAAESPDEGPVTIIAGTLGRHALIDRLARDGRLDVTGVRGEWEAYVHQIVDDPAPGIDRALVIAGADRRGTIFGIYDLSQRIGVSPWHWWADVPVARRADLFVHPGRRVEKPAVRYRGIFINDENPALFGWANQTFGGFNARFYERVFELILRMRGNYLWPAMWGKSLYEDDPASPGLADEMGVVIGTSHHEPMMRAHVDWLRRDEGEWDYTSNAERLRRFWREGIERMGENESLVTIGMRGNGDEPMAEGTATELLERIVRDQRTILEEVTGRPAAETPQVWALYKEVQDYYDAGMRVPDDVTLLFADDNWGNIRRLPEPGAERPGGYGVYYHFDYVGGPRNYKWLNTNQIERVWEQMNLAYRHGADRLWIVNVGDIKPMEFPTSFFLDYAWNPEQWPLERLADYPRIWAARQFGDTHAEAIGEIVTSYSRLAARRKPELLGPETYSLIHFDEADRVAREWGLLQSRAETIEAALTGEYRDAYFQLVLHPIQALGNLHALYRAVALNRRYAAQGRAGTNALAEEAQRLFARDREIRRRYEEQTAGGRWAHMMSQTHIGYTGWQQPEQDVMPEVRTIDLPERAAMGVAVEGSDGSWVGNATGARLPAFDNFNRQQRSVEVFNRGRAPFQVTARSPARWIRLPSGPIEVEGGADIPVEIDWTAAPHGRRSAPVLLRGSEGSEVTVEVETLNPAGAENVTGFVESGGQIAIEAAHHDRAVGGSGVEWRTIPNLGFQSGVTAFPVTAPPQTLRPDGPRLEYAIHLFEAGEVELQVILSPTLDYRGSGGLRYAVSIDDEPPQIVNVHAGTTDADWDRAVADNRWVRSTRHRVAGPGRHVIRLWLVDPGLVFQRLLVASAELPPTYLGPPESARR